MTSRYWRPLVTLSQWTDIIYDVTQSLIASNRLMTSYVSMTSYTLTRPSLVTLWDFIANIGQQQNVGQGKSYWLSGPYILLSSTLTFWQGALSNITFIIFAVFDVWNKIAVDSVINWSFFSIIFAVFLYFQVILSILKVEWQYVISSE